jgi:hypothetical protein
MESHVRRVAVLTMVFGALSGVIALILLGVYGGLEGLLNVTERADWAASALVPVMRFLGGTNIILALFLAVPCVLLGMGLMKFRPWSRNVAMVVAVLELAMLPLGTALAIYTLWVLLSLETEPLFTSPPTR